jgi:ribosomal protein L36
MIKRSMVIYIICSDNDGLLRRKDKMTEYVEKD